MKLLCDESVDRRIARRLQQDGVDVFHVADRQPGTPDPEVLEMARSDQAVLMTEDKDFGDLVHRQGLTHAGVILLRLVNTPAAVKCDLVSQAVLEHWDEMVGRFSVISNRGLRIRGPITAEPD